MIFLQAPISSQEYQSRLHNLIQFSATAFLSAPGAERIKNAHCDRFIYTDVYYPNSKGAKHAVSFYLLSPTQIFRVYIRKGRFESLTANVYPFGTKGAWVAEGSLASYLKSIKRTLGEIQYSDFKPEFRSSDLPWLEHPDPVFVFKLDAHGKLSDDYEAWRRTGRLSNQTSDGK